MSPTRKARRVRTFIAASCAIGIVVFLMSRPSPEAGTSDRSPITATNDLDTELLACREQLGSDVVHDRVNAAFAIARLAIRLQGGFDLSPEPGVSRLRVPYDPPVSDKDQDSAPRLSLEYIDVTEVHREFLPAVAALCKAAESDPSLDVRVNAVFAVGAISPGEREAHAMLLGALSNAESRVGNNALAALTHYGRRAAAFAVELTEIARTGSVRAATRACAVLRAIRWANADMVVENFRRRLEQGDVASRAELDVVLSTSDREWFARLLPELVSD